MMQQKGTLRDSAMTRVWHHIFSGIRRPRLAFHGRMVVGANHDEVEPGDAQGSLH